MNKIPGLIFLFILSYFTINGKLRPQHYIPEGNSALAINGETRFNRGLYGAHTGFRIDCSDYPEFGIYLPRMGGNLQLTLPSGDCIARYTPGRMDYQQGGVTVETQVGRKNDIALWAIKNHNKYSVSIPVRFGGVSDKKFSREGDLGVDDPTCFDLKPEYCEGNKFSVNNEEVRVEFGKNREKNLLLIIPATRFLITDLPTYEGIIELKPGEQKIIGLFPNGKTPSISLESLLNEVEKDRSELAESIKFHTPEKWLNPIAGALAIAADGIWSGEAWLHGSIGWRTPHLGWRGAYVGTAIGKHDRALTHFKTYAANQITDIPPIFSHPRQDSSLNLARAEKKWGTPMYSNGYICRRPGKKDEMSHYDMNIVYIDAMLRYFRATGDTISMRELFPVIKRHLEWEKRNFDPDNNKLYDAYCCIWASDALYYSGGDVTHSSAYNLFANRLAAQVAEAIGEDPKIYIEEAEGIAKAIDSVLWMPERGHWVEYRDATLHQRLHPSAALWTIYHTIDSEIPDPFKAYAATKYIDGAIPHIPVEGEGIEGGLFTLSTTNWKPYSWSINNVAIAEVIHTALAYWQAGRNEEAYALMKSVAFDNMYFGVSPLNFGQISYYDKARGECYRDFADPIGVWSRALTEGLFGIRPDLLAKEPTVHLTPGFPKEWKEASIDLPNFAYSYKHNGKNITYKIRNGYGNNSMLRLTLATSGIKSVIVNGKKAEWNSALNSIGTPRIEINAGTDPFLEIEIIECDDFFYYPTGQERNEGPITFKEMESGELSWWLPITNSFEYVIPVLEEGFNDVKPELCEVVDLRETYNSNVTDIFQNEYLSPRPLVTTLQLPKQGMGEWCHPTLTADIDDSGLRTILKNSEGLIKTENGIPFALPYEGKNISFTSLWDNYPDRVTIPLTGNATHLYLVMAGSTNHMQSGIENGKLIVKYADGEDETTPLINPYNWAPIELDYYNDEYAFALPERALPPYRLHFKTGKMSRYLGDELGIKGVADRFIEGGAGIVLDIPVDPRRKLESLTLETLSGDVVIGLMAMTIQRLE